MRYGLKINSNIGGRQASNLVYRLSEVDGSITIIKGDRMINAKSIIGLLSLDLKKNDLVEISCDADIYTIDHIFKEVLG